MIAFWVVAPCSLVEVQRRFRDASCLHHQDDDPLYISVTSILQLNLIRRRNRWFCLILSFICFLLRLFNDSFKTHRSRCQMWRWLFVNENLGRMLKKSWPVLSTITSIAWKHTYIHSIALDRAFSFPYGFHDRYFRCGVIRTTMNLILATWYDHQGHLLAKPADTT
jgi:hypothetical protein